MRVSFAIAALAATSFAAPASAQIFHYDPADDFTITRSGIAPVGRLTVSSAQTINSFGVLMRPNAEADLTFLIFNSDTSELLYQSVTQAVPFDRFTRYYYSAPLNFTFQPGTTYGLTALSSVERNYRTDRVANTVGEFNFLLGNQNAYGTRLDTGQGCCDVATALVLAENVTAAVPEPATWAMMLVGFGAIGTSMRRRKALASLKEA